MSIRNLTLRTLGGIGNSLSGNVWVESPDDGLYWQWEKLLKAEGVDLLDVIPKLGGGGSYDAVNNWLRLRSTPPDLFLLQGWIEQEITTTYPATISAQLTTGQTSATFSGGNTYVGVCQLYDSSGNYEWILSGTSGGTLIRRGLFGTTPRNWPSGTTVLGNSSVTTWAGLTAYRAAIEALARDVAAAGNGRLPIILLHDQWPLGTLATGFRSGMQALVDTLRLSGINAGFVPYTKADGTNIADDPLCIGPCAVISTCTYGGETPPTMTIVCKSTGAGLGKENKLLRPGMLVGIWNSGTAIAKGTVEYCRITALTADGFTVVGAAGRSQLGSTAITDFGDGDIVGYYSLGSEIPRSEYMTLWTNSRLNFAYDAHPLSSGYAEIAKSGLRTLRTIAG